MLAEFELYNLLASCYGLFKSVYKYSMNGTP
mgnify:CR=1 FL=1